MLASDGAPLWPLPLLATWMASRRYVFAPFYLFCSCKHNSPNTCGTKWNENIKCHFMLDFMHSMANCWWKKRVLRAVNKLPHTKPLLVPIKDCEIIGDWHLLLSKTWTSIKIILILIFRPVIFPAAKIKPWVSDKWNSCDQISYIFPSQNSLEFLIGFFRENMIHVYPHVSSPCHSKGV